MGNLKPMLVDCDGRECEALLHATDNLGREVRVPLKPLLDSLARHFVAKSDCNDGGAAVATAPVTGRKSIREEIESLDKPLLLKLMGNFKEALDETFGGKSSPLGGIVGAVPVAGVKVKSPTEIAFNVVNAFAELEGTVRRLIAEDKRAGDPADVRAARGLALENVKTLKARVDSIVADLTASMTAPSPTAGTAASPGVAG